VLTDVLQLTVVGLVVGSILGLGSIGLTLTYGILKFANFSHGDLMALGMFITYFFVGNLGWMGPRIGPLSVGWGIVPAIGLSMAVVAGWAALVDRFVYRPLRAREGAVIVMAIASLGIAIMTRAVIEVVWGPKPLRYSTGINEAWSFGAVHLKPDQILTMAMAVVAMGLLYFLLYRTRLGRAMRATADNPVLAEISGIDTERVRLAVWVIAGAFIAVAGTMFGVQSQIRFDAGFTFLLPMFAAVILGGIGNPWGAMAGALIVGVSQEVSTLWLATGFKTAVPFALLILMLIVRPRGLFGSTI
jgi:branched-chain amino acid transport system permease protein/neutral amino acid transport system permease protein